MKKTLFITFLCLMFAMFTNTANAQMPGDVTNGCCFWLEQIDPAQVVIADGLDDWELSKYHLNPIIPGPDGIYGTADDNLAKAEYYYFRFHNCFSDPKTKLSIDWEFLVNDAPFDRPLDATPANRKNFMNVEIEWLLPLINPSAFQGSGPLLSGMGLKSNITPPYTTISNVKRAVVTDFPGQIDSSPYGTLFGYFNPYGLQTRWYNYIYADFLQWACDHNYLRVKITRYTTDDVKAQFKLKQRIDGIDFQEWYIGDQQHDYMGGHQATLGPTVGNFWLGEQEFVHVVDTKDICGIEDPIIVDFNDQQLVINPPSPYPVYPEAPITTTVSYPIFNEEYLIKCGIGYLDTLVSLDVVWHPMTPAPVRDSVHLCGPGIATLTASEDENDPFVYKWYLSPTSNFVIHTGKTYTLPYILPNMTYTFYVTATFDGCESVRTPFVVRVDRQVRAWMRNVATCPTAAPENFCREVLVFNGYGNYSYDWSVNVISSNDNEGCILLASNDCNESQTIGVTVTDLFSGCTATAESTITINDGRATLDIDDIEIESEIGSENNMFECLYDADPETIGYPDVYISCDYTEPMYSLDYEDDITTPEECENNVVYSIERTWTLEKYCGEIIQKIQKIDVKDTDAPRSARSTSLTIETVTGENCDALIPEGTIANLKDLLELYDNCTVFDEIGTTLYKYLGGVMVEELEDGDIIPFIEATFDYYVEAIDACENTRLIPIYFEKPANSFKVTITTEQTTLCNTGAAFELATVLENGIPDYSYQWGFVAGSCDDCTSTLTPDDEEGTCTVVPTIDPDHNLVNHQPRYFVIVTDDYGCKATDTITITILPLPEFEVEIDSILCYGGEATVTFTPQAGVGKFFFYKDNVLENFDYTATMVLTAGTYEIRVVDQNGCEAIKNVIITQPDLLEVTATAAQIMCHSDEAAITVTVTGGTEPYTYFYDGDEIDDIELFSLPAGEHEITVIDAHECEATTTITITEPDTIIATATIDIPVLCFGGNASVIIEVEGGTAPFTYIYDGEEYDENTFSLPAGDYEITVVDDNGCEYLVEFTIDQPDTLIASVYLAGQNTLILCHGDATGSLTASATGGTTPYNFLWNTGATTATITDLVAGTYFVTITDDNGCIDTASYTLTEPDTLLANITLLSSILCAGNATGSLSSIPSGGTPPYNYLWSTGAITATISGLVAGTYTVTVTDENLCVAIESYILTEPDTLKPSIVLVDTIKCYGQEIASLTASATGGIAPYTFLWNTGAITAHISGLAAGTYSVTITDDNDCEATAVFEVTEPDLLIIDFDGTEKICNDGDGTITADPQGGTGPFTYEWSNGATTATISNLGIGTYTVTVTDANGCTATGEFEIEYYNEISLVVEGHKGCSDTQATIDVTLVVDPGVTADLKIYVYGYVGDINTATIIDSIIYLGANAGTYTFPYTLIDAPTCTFGGINYLYFIATAFIDPCTYTSAQSASVNYTNAPLLYVYEDPSDRFDNIMGGGPDIPGEKIIHLGEMVTHYFMVDDYCNEAKDINLSVNYTYYYTDLNGVTTKAAPITQYLTNGAAGFMRFITPINCSFPTTVNYSYISEESYFPFRTTTSGWYYQGNYFDYFKLAFFDEKEIKVELSGFIQPGTYTIEYALVTHRNVNGNCDYGTPFATTCNGVLIGGYGFHLVAPGFTTVVLAKNTMTIIVSGTPIIPSPKPTTLSNTHSRIVNIFPNPASDRITLSFEDMEGDAKVSIVNLTGSLVLDQKINITSKNVNIDLPDLQPGFYFVYITSNDAVIARKLVIEQKIR